MQYFIFECRRSLEVKAQSELSALGMDVLLPMAKKFIKRRRHRNKETQEVLLPLWSGYIVGGAEIVNWYQLRKRFDNPNCALLRPLMIDGEAYPIGPHLVSEIRNRTWLTLAPFSEGDSVRIERGPFSGYVGKLVDLGDSEAEVMLDLLGKSVLAKFEPAILEKAA